MGPTPLPRILVGADDWLGAHVAHLLLSRAEEAVAFFALRDDPAALRTRMHAAFDEVGWVNCLPPEPELLAKASWLWRGTELDAYAGGECWHLESCDPLVPSATAEHLANLSEALRLAQQLRCQRFVYVSTFSCPDPDDDATIAERVSSSAECAVAQACTAAGIAFTVLRVSMVVGPAATLRMDRRAGQSSPLHRWLTASLAGSGGLASVRHRIRVNLTPVDYFLADLALLLDSELGDQPVRHLTGGKDFVVEYTPRAGGDPSLARTTGSLALTGEGGTVDVQPCATAFARSVPARWQVYPNTVRGYVEAATQDLRGLSVAKVFRMGSGRSADGLELIAYESGSDANPLVVLVNAYGMPAEFVAPLAAHLAASFHVLTWETRGVPHERRPFDVEAVGPVSVMKDLRALLDARGRQPTHLIGWCNGAQTALQFAQAWPDRVQRLVFLNGGIALDPPCLATEYEVTLGGLMKAASKSRASAHLLSQMMWNQKGDEAPVQGSAYLEHIAKLPFRSGESFFRYAHAVRSFASERLTEDPLLRKSEVLLISSHCDAVVHPDVGQRVARRIPGARHVEMDNADHMSVYGDERIARVIAEFLATGAIEATLERQGITEQRSG